MNSLERCLVLQIGSSETQSMSSGSGPEPGTYLGKWVIVLRASGNLRELITQLSA